MLSTVCKPTVIQKNIAASCHFIPPSYLQAAKPFASIPLLGCTVKDSPQDLQGQPGFCVSQSGTTHTFSCDSLDLRHSWVDALRVTGMGKTPGGTRTGCNSTTNGSTCGSHGNVNSESVSSDEEFLIIDSKEIP